MNTPSGAARVGAGAVLVTGGASGIGRGIVETFVDAGHTVIIADRDLPAAQATAGELSVRGEAIATYLDVTDPAQIHSVFAEIDREHPLEGVICNAGIAFSKPTIDVTPEEFDRLMSVNLRGVFFTMQAALRVMAPRSRGSIVTISSTSGFTASTGAMAAYDSSKAAVRLLTMAIAKEFASKGIRVNSVAPGTVETALTRGLASSEELAALGINRVPMGRLGRPEEIGAACLFLASGQASYITGQTLAVDGGWLA